MRWIDSGNGKVLPQRARIRYFFAVASRGCDMQKPLEKLSGEPLSLSPYTRKLDPTSMIAS
jgi:hypothetical protein